jgi:Methylamine utilisation protein MauE
MVNIAISSRCLLAFVFACSAVAKLRSGGSFRTFRAWLADLPVPVAPRHAGALAAAVAGAEVLIVLLAVLPWTVLAGFALAGATLATFIAGTSLAIARGTKAACNCFGARGAPLGRRHVARDTVLLAVATVGAVASNAHGARPAGIAVSVATASFLAVLIVFLDDVLSLLAVGSPNLAGARRREG